MSSQKGTETLSCELITGAITGICKQRNVSSGPNHEFISTHDDGSDGCKAALRRASALSIRSSRSIEKNSSASSVALGSS